MISSDEMEYTDNSSEDDSQEEEREQISSGKLNSDLFQALSRDFDFAGNYYHRSVELNAPNPVMTIKGVGAIGLPLSERDAATIISRAAQAPFGKGDQTIIDTSVRDTWEIEPANVSFLNPKWDRFVEEIAMEKVWTTLGVAPYKTKPRCELYKLLLYQTGSHFLPHQDTAKADGMFATMVIVLPSAFQGGHVHVHHTGRSAVLDVSKDSLLNTSVLAWYTDVFHEIKPVTSGYRLALSYNLIHTSLNTPQPTLPCVPQHALQPLRQTLEKWRDNKYQHEFPDPPLYAYTLSHQYSEDDLKRGTRSLKGRDAHLMSYILPIIDEMGFIPCLATLCKMEFGIADDHGSKGGCNRRRWGDHSDEESTPPMDRIEETTFSLSNLVRISGNEAFDLMLQNFQEIEEESLVPRNLFSDMVADRKEYEGYQGNGAGTLSQWYHRSALVLFRKDDETSILMQFGGPMAVLNVLPLTAKATASVQDIMRVALDRLSNSADAITILDLAISWMRHDIWNQAIQFVDTVDDIEGVLGEAVDVFELDLIQPGLLQLIKRQSGLQNQLDVIKAVAAYLPDDINSNWIQILIKDTMLSYAAASVTDVPALLELAQELEGGIVILSSIIIPRTASRANTYDFHLALTEAFDRKRNDLLSSDDGNIDVAEIAVYRNLTRQCLLAASSQWASQPAPPGPSSTDYYYNRRHNTTLSPTVLTERINGLIKTCISSENPDLCTQIAKSVGVDRQLDILNVIRSNTGSSSSSPTWVKELMRTVVSTYATPALSHTHILAWIAEELGPVHIQTLVTTKISKSGTYTFLLGLAKSLHKQISLQDDVRSEETKVSFRTAIAHCILLAYPQWEGTQQPVQNNAYRSVASQANSTEPSAKIKRILEVVEICFTIGDLDPCFAFFTDLLKVQHNDTVIDKFKDLYIPILHHLKAILTSHGKTHMLEPFKSLFRGIISLYLGQVLSAIPPTPYPVLPVRSTGCNCLDCNRVKDFLLVSTPAIEFKVKQPARIHIEKQITETNLGRLVTCITARRGSPYTLVVSKRPEFVSSIKWKEAKTAAVHFLRRIGDTDTDLKELMQEKYGDMLKALEGTQVFVVSESTCLAATNTASSSSASVLSSANDLDNVPQVAGAKRKYQKPPTNVIDVIDLT